MGARNASSRTARLRCLILGGTGEARVLAQRMVEHGHGVTTALAGRTRNPAALPGAVRTGGFGGADGLAAYLRDQRIERLIDATHPFAAQISANAVAAAAQTRTPLLRLARPAWTMAEHWRGVDDLVAAANALPQGARAFLTIGRQGLAPFLARTDCRFLARMIEPVAAPPHIVVLAETGPFAREEERALMRAHAITHLVTKNSGGHETEAKLEAADALGITIIMVRRPALPQAWTVEDVAAVLAWLQATSPSVSNGVVPGR